MNPKISVIVPVYKAEKYLHRCVDSILAQTFTDFEVLLIDDGSPDRSGEICDEYAQKDSRVRVFHKENGGVSSARQCGIDNAQGEYTIHADPDDWVEPKMLEELYAKAKEDDADMVICDFFVNNKESQKYVSQQPSSLQHIEVAVELQSKLHGATWNKLIKRSCIIQNHVKFDYNLSFCEDLFYCTQLLLNPIKVTYLDKAFYHYIQDVNTNSLVKTYTLNSLKHDISLYAKAQENFKGTDVYKAATDNYGYLLVCRAFHGDVLSSAEFFRHCGRHTDCVINREGLSTLMKTIYLLSCIGLYRPIIGLYKFMSNIKKRI